MCIKEADNAYPLSWNPATPGPLPDGAKGGPGFSEFPERNFWKLAGWWVTEMAPNERGVRVRCPVVSPGAPGELGRAGSEARGCSVDGVSLLGEDGFSVCLGAARANPSCLIPLTAQLLQETLK